MTHDKKKKQDLGIFYTREDIAEFVFDIVLLWKEREDREQKRWESHKPGHYPSVIDPTCGEGIFLKKAVEKGFTRPDWIFGMDIDEAVVKKWPEINLLKAFEGDEEKLKAHFFHQNGLKRIQWNQHKNEYHKKLKKEDMENEQFDLAVGNPPYGGMGLEAEEFNDELISQLAGYNILPADIKREIDYKGHQQGVLDLFDTGKSKTINQKVKDRLKSFPIEVLFIDRFIQLAKPGGWVAVVIPDGILSNSNLHYVRQYIADRAKVEAIVSLPRDAFKHVGTSAKTSILFLQKFKAKALSYTDVPDNVTQPLRVENLNYPVFLACLYKMEGPGLKQIFEQYKEFYYEGRLKSL